MSTQDRNVEHLKEPFKTKVKMFLKEVGDKIFITEWLRTAERQAELYAKWRTIKWPKVTWVKHSNHQDWIAIDIAFMGDSLYPIDIKQWKTIAKIASSYWIDWWYDLWSIDKPHFQDNGKPLVIKEKPMEEFWPNITVNWYTFPSSIYWVKIELREWLDRTWMLKLKWATTDLDSYILLSDYTAKKGINKIKEVLLHEFSHIIYHTIIKTSIFEKIDNTDMKLTKYEYWYYLSRNLKHYITKYASTHSAEDFAELIGYWYYIKNKLDLPSKATWNNDIKFKYIIANNLYKHWLEQYLKS